MFTNNSRVQARNGQRKGATTPQEHSAATEAFWGWRRDKRKTKGGPQRTNTTFVFLLYNKNYVCGAVTWKLNSRAALESVGRCVDRALWL